MSEGFTCRGCGNLFFQAPKCVACGAQKLYDSTVKLQGKEIEAQAARIAELEAAVATLIAERDQLIGALQIAVERSGDMEHPPAWVDAACCILNRGFLKVDRAALGEKE